ncbi:MAG TPA: hypothetical protein VNU66_08885 [Mycobacteriales bacterium]|nr:hypothetical protein [Mycobacteriales bacterium]
MERVRTTWAELARGTPPAPPPSGRLVVEVTGPGAPDLRALDALARLVLAARRGGADVRVHDPGGGLAPLLALTGLDDAVRLS